MPCHGLNLQLSFGSSDVTIFLQRFWTLCQNSFYCIISSLLLSFGFHWYCRYSSLYSALLYLVSPVIFIIIWQIMWFTRSSCSQEYQMNLCLTNSWVFLSLFSSVTQIHAYFNVMLLVISCLTFSSEIALTRSANSTCGCPQN